MIGLLALGLVVGVAGFFATGVIAEEVEDQTTDQQMALAQAEAQNFDSWHQQNVIVTEALVERDEIRTGDPSNEFLQSQLQPGATDIHFVDDVDREVLVSTTSEFEGQSFDDLEAVEADGPWAELESFEEADSSVEYREAKFHGIFEGHDGTHVAAYSKPVETPGGAFEDFEGVIIYTVSVDSLAGELPEDGGQLAYVVDSSNDQVLADPAGESGLTSYGHTDELTESVGSTTLGMPGDALATSLRTSFPDDAFDEEPYIVSYAATETNEDWYVAVHTSEEQAYGFVYTVQEYGTYLSIAGTFFIVLVGGILARNTSRSLNTLEGQAKQIGEGNLEVEFETKRIDSIGQLYDEFSRMRDSLKHQIQEAQDAREEAERARERTEQVNAELESKADEYRSVMRHCAQGDLTARLDPETENDAMREIGEEFNLMIDEIEQTTELLKGFATEVATRSEQVTASSEEVRSASEQVTSSVQEISDGADRQNESLQSVTHEMNGLSTTTEEIAASSNEVADIAERTAKTGHDGREAAQAAIAGMNQIETESQNAVEEIERLEAEMEQIDELLTFITEIAEQTNMLALNANIEAARSGSSGEGFSVVASEVKELAEETKDAAEDIERRLEQIKTQTDRTAEEVQMTSQRVSENTDSVESAVDALDEIAEYAEETNNGVQEISAASQQQAASTQEVVAMVDEAATIAEQTSGESENVAAAAEEQTSSLTEVSQSANDLAGKAVQLSQALDRFDTDAEAADALGDDADLEEETTILAETDGLVDAFDIEDDETDAGEPSEPLEGFTYDETSVTDEVEDSDDDPVSAGQTHGAPETDDPLAAPVEESAVENEPEPIAVEPSDDPETEAFAVEPDEDSETDQEPIAVEPDEQLPEADDPLAAPGEVEDDPLEMPGESPTDGTADPLETPDQSAEAGDPIADDVDDVNDDPTDLFDSEGADDDAESDAEDTETETDSAEEGDDSSENEDVFSFGDSR